jgi:hypothetical protein
VVGSPILRRSTLEETLGFSINGRRETIFHAPHGDIAFRLVVELVRIDFLIKVGVFDAAANHAGPVRDPLRRLLGQDDFCFSLPSSMIANVN